MVKLETVTEGTTFIVTWNSKARNYFTEASFILKGQAEQFAKEFKKKLKPEIEVKIWKMTTEIIEGV